MAIECWPHPKKKKCIYHYFVGLVQGQVLGVKPRGLASISSSSHCKAAIYMYKAAAAAAAGLFCFVFLLGDMVNKCSLCSIDSTAHVAFCFILFELAPVGGRARPMICCNGTYIRRAI